MVGCCARLAQPCARAQHAATGAVEATHATGAVHRAGFELPGPPMLAAWLRLEPKTATRATTGMPWQARSGAARPDVALGILGAALSKRAGGLRRLPHLPVASSSLRTAVTASTTSRPKKSLSAPTILLLMAVLAAAMSVSAPRADVGMASFSCRYLQACMQGGAARGTSDAAPSRRATACAWQQQCPGSRLW